MPEDAPRDIAEVSSQAFDTPHWPTELRYSKADKTLTVTFDDGRSFHLPAEFLRVESPSAEVQGHGPDQKQIVSGRRHVGIMAIEPVGNYAVRIKFDDLHDTGIYSWQYLRRLGEDQDQLWRDYLKALADRGLSRDPPGRQR
ncbi:MAG: gamma-butyrobetaine hydroxylase-like domain-containing protein [Kiloniellales bacterium]